MAMNISVPDSTYSNIRRWPRFKLDVPLRVIAPKEGKVVIVQGRGNELNQGGMAVFAGIELKLDDRIAVEFTPPYSGQPIRVRGCIRNRKGYQYGIEFLLETDDDYAHVSQIIGVLGAMGLRVC
jgi:hypothetical protein